MNTRAALEGQYHAALAMLKQTIEQCPDDLWAAGELSSSCMVVCRLHQDGTIEGTRLSKDVWNKLKEGTRVLLARPLPAEPAFRTGRDRTPAQP